MKMSPNPAKRGSSLNNKLDAGRRTHIEGAGRPSRLIQSTAFGAKRVDLGRTFFFLLVAALLFVSAHRLLAPISELSESPTPSEHLAKPKAKRTKVTSENSESSTKRQTSSTPPRSQPTPQRNPFDGTWRGIILCGLAGNVDLTFQISANGKVLTTNAHFFDWLKTLKPTCDGHTMTWKTTPIQTWTLTPNADGQTALVTGNDPGALFGFGAFNSSADFSQDVAMKRTLTPLLAVALHLITAHRLPAPIQEIPESPTPALKAQLAQTPKATPKPKPKPSKGEIASRERKRTRPDEVATASAAAQPTVTKRKAKRFAGTWMGTMHAENGQTYPVTVIVDPTETKVTANGPVFANEEGRIQIDGDTFTWNWMLDSWTMTLSSETTAQLVKRYFNSTHTGTVQRTK